MSGRVYYGCSVGLCVRLLPLALLLWVASAANDRTTDVLAAAAPASASSSSSSSSSFEEVARGARQFLGQSHDAPLILRGVDADATVIADDASSRAHHPLVLPNDDDKKDEMDKTDEASTSDQNQDPETQSQNQEKPNKARIPAWSWVAVVAGGLILGLVLYLPWTGLRRRGDALDDLDEHNVSALGSAMPARAASMELSRIILQPSAAPAPRGLAAVAEVVEPAPEPGTTSLSTFGAEAAPPPAPAPTAVKEQKQTQEEGAAAATGSMADEETETGTGKEIEKEEQNDPPALPQTDEGSSEIANQKDSSAPAAPGTGDVPKAAPP